MNVLHRIHSLTLGLVAALAAILFVEGSRAASLPPMAFELPTSLTGTVRDGVVDSEGNFAFLAGGTLHQYSRGGFQMFSQQLPLTPAAVATGAGGETYVAGKTGAEGSLDLAVAKYAADGTLAWVRTAGGPDPGNDEAYDVVVDDQGGIYAAGYTTVDMSDAFVVKYNAEGVEQWTRRFNGSASGNDYAFDLVSVPGGGVVACGLARNLSAAFLTIRYDAAGTAQWTSFYALSAAIQLGPIDIVRTSDGGFAVAGYTGAGITVVKYSDTGNQLWNTPVPGATGIGGVAAGADGEVAVITIGSMRSDDIGFPMIGPVSVSGVSGTGVGWNVPLGDAEYLGGTYLVPGESGGYYATAGYSTRYHTQAARLAGMKPGGADLTVQSLPSFLSNMLGGPVAAYTLRSGADGSFWMIYNSPMNSSLLLRRYGVSAPPPVPGVVTGGVENLHRDSAVLTGQIDPKGAGLTWRFEYSYFASTFTTPWRQVSGPGAVSVSEPVSALSPITYQYRLVVSNGAGTFYGDYRTFKPLSPYQDWAASVFGSHTAPGSGPLEDPDSDGAVNLLEYAFGSQGNVPGGGDRAPVFESWSSPDTGLAYLSLVYQPVSLHWDVIITPVASNDLINWTETGITVRNESGGVLRAVAMEQQRFLRLKVTQQPPFGP